MDERTLDTEHAKATAMQQDGPVTLNSSNIHDFLQKYDNFLVDCDGVLWSDNFTALSDISLGIKHLLSIGKKLYYVTNNTIDSHEGFMKKLTAACGYDVPPDHLFRASRAMAYYIKEVIKMEDGKVYALGGKGLTDELDKVGIQYVGFGPDLDPISSEREDLLKLYMDTKVKGVVIAFDRHFSYNKFFKAVSYLSKPDCFYLLSSDKEVIVNLAPGYVAPVTGAIGMAVTHASKRTPTVIGKPERILYDCILSEFPNVDPSKTVMVGDSLKTDIPFAHRCGLDCLLVLTGMTSLQDVEATKQNTKLGSSERLPTYVTKSIADFGPMASNK